MTDIIESESERPGNAETWFLETSLGQVLLECYADGNQERKKRIAQLIAEGARNNMPSNVAKACRVVWRKITEQCPHLQGMDFNETELRMIGSSLISLVRDEYRKASRQAGQWSPVDLYIGSGSFDPEDQESVEGLMNLIDAQSLMTIINFINNKWIMQNMTQPNQAPELSQVAATRGQVAGTLS